MPGLVGIIPKQYDPNGQLLERMNKAIAHRKFHQKDKYSGPFFHLGRVHIGIFNPEPQPIFNEDRSLCIFMDGKIYDYEEEVNRLRLKGHTIVGQEPEFCLHSYEELGKDFAKKLNGCFLIVICDLKKKRLLIVNDRYAFRPLYFSYDGNRMLFSSEAKAILEDQSFKREINDEAVANFFAFGQLLAGQTLFKGINVLLPASILTCEGGKVSLEQYWNLEYAEDYPISEEDLLDQLVEAMKKAVDKRISRDKRYGVSLSGGLDSRSIVAAIDKSKKDVITAYTYGSPGNDEEKVARVVATKAGINHKLIHFRHSGVYASHNKEVVYLTDGIDFLTLAYIPYVYERIRHFIDVTLISPMGSYVFGGDMLDPNIMKSRSDEELLGIFYRKMMWRGVGEGVMAKLFTKEYYDKIKDMPLNSLRECLEKTRSKHPGNRIDEFWVQNVVNRFNILGHVLRRNYVEDTSPLYDNDFFDVMLKIPPELRIGHHIFVKFLKKLSPELAKIPYQRTMIPASAPLILWNSAKNIQDIKEIIKKRMWWLSKGKIFLPNKRSYVDPDELFRICPKWRIIIKALLLDKKRLSKEYFNEDYIQAIIKEHESGEADHSQMIICLATFELFHRLFLGHRSRASNI